MEKILDLNNTIYELTAMYPESIEIMKDLGFTAIDNPLARNTMGKAMTIPTGCKFQNISMDKVIEAFKSEGFDIVS